ncbi:PREDICTED: probable ATP-dependent RNA helicase CG8611 isoform X2 [Papilio xuthus]|uniref:ATP-dependent RNA helicase n=1 Tax=Papilio xuthus TaxID=66420 RepID=A0AAJ7E8J7_PAPXU|nr:PREDICTED: probable ATP-dependent RNA helicase CG8611 isoform X2 [Papilio xuthus]
MDDLQLNISSVKKNNKTKKGIVQQSKSSEYKFVPKPVVSGKIIARKRPQNAHNKFSSARSDEPKQKVSRLNDAPVATSNDLETKLRDLSENKGKFKDKNYQEIVDDLQVKQKPRSGGWISSLFKNNPDVPRIGQKAVKPIVEKVFTAQTFSELDLHPHSIANLNQNLNLKQLMTVQQNSIPVILQGRDVLIRSQTGSGKTLAYALPIIEGLQAIRPKINRHDGIRVIVVVPTRELAVQTYELFVKLVKPFIWIVPGLLSGGQKRKAEKARLRKGLSILVGTPGRINDHLRHTHSFNFAKTGCLVLDEADRLLDMGYEKDVAAIVKAIEDHKKAATYDPIALMRQSVNKNISNDEKSVENASTENTEENQVKHHLTEVFLSKNRQTILLSATLTKAVENLAGITMQDPVFVDTSEGKVLVADSLKHIGDLNKIDDNVNNKKDKIKSDPISPQKPNLAATQKVENNLTNSLNNIEIRRVAFSGINIEDQPKDVKDEKASSKTATKRKHESDSDSDYEYFKVQKELEAKKPKKVEEVKEIEPIKKDNVFEEAVKSAVVDDELVLPATVNQKFLIVPMKLRLVTLCSLIVEHCYLDKKCGKMIVFMATTEMVDYHSELLETVLTGNEAKVKKKEDKNKKTKTKKQKKNDKGDDQDSSESSDNSDSEFEMEYEAPDEGGLVPIDLDVFSLHGSMPHERRMEVFKQFRAAKRGLLICTDVAARGLDVPRVDLVLQYCAPASATDYVHRVGRTGRAAQVGAAILMLLPSEAEFVRHLEQKRIRLRQTDESQSLEALRTLAPTASNPARAAIAVQTRLEHTAHSHRDWLARASRAYTSWVRSYSGYPREVRMWLDARQLHLGHAAKAFALRETPAALARRAKSDPNFKKERPVNRLTIHEEEQKKRPGFPKMKAGMFGNKVVNKQSSMHTACEFDSGLPPIDTYNFKKKNKNKQK